MGNLVITKISGKPVPPVAKRLERQWVTCTHCGWTGYYDYLPYSLSGGIIVMNCGHDMVDTSVRKRVTENEAVSLLNAFRKWNS